MKYTPVTIFTSLCLILSAAAADRSLTGVFVYPSEDYNQECVKYCKESKVDDVYIWAEYFKKGLANPYKDAGFNVICGKVPWHKMRELKLEEMRAAAVKWAAEYLGPGALDTLSGFEIDEPFAGHGNWAKETLTDVESDKGFQELFQAKFKCAAPARLTPDTDRLLWREMLSMRHRLFAERLAAVADAFQKEYPSKSMTLNLTPAIYESGSNTGVDITELNSLIPQNVTMTADPYFQAFRRPLQWAGMNIKMLRAAMGERELGGIIQFYDVIKDSGWPHEGYEELRPGAVRRQVFEFLMSGATNISAFVLAKRLGTPELRQALKESLIFVKNSETLWRGTKPFAQAGVYFSENSFRMRDMWGPWSKMTGLYGASFQAEWTYYNLSSLHIPAGIITADFNGKKDLLAELRGYPLVILPDVKCVSPREAEALTKYVSEGGSLIVTGETSLFNENGEPLPAPSLAALTGVESVQKTDQKTLTILKNDLVPQFSGVTLSFDGNASELFKKQASRHPQWLKDKCAAKKSDSFDTKFPGKIPPAFSWSLKPAPGAAVLAEHPDKSAAIVMKKTGKGLCVSIAPSDLTLFKGSVTDTLEFPEGQDKNAAVFLARLADACAGSKLIDYSGPDGVELSVRRGPGTGDWRIFLLNHSDRPAADVRISLNIPLEKVAGISVLDQLKDSGSPIAPDMKNSGSNTVINIPPLRYGMILRVTERQ